MFGSALWEIALAVGAVLLLIFVLNPKAASRLKSWMGGLVTGCVDWLVKSSDPVKVMEYENDKLATDIEAAWEGVEDKQALINQLNRQITDDEKESNRLAALAKVEAGKNNDAAAKDYLVQKVRIDKSLGEKIKDRDTNQDELEEYQATIDSCQRKLNGNKAEAKRLKVELKISSAEARVLKRLPNLNSNNSAADEARANAYEQLDHNKAVAKVARDRRRQQTAVEKAEDSADELEAQKMLDELKGKS
jgi:hypothetical protein